MRIKIYFSLLTAFLLFISAVNQVSAQCTESFDGVTAPALPTGWVAVTNTSGAGTVAWATTTTGANSAPNAATTNDPGAISDEWLTSTNFPITSTTAQLTFKNNFNLESGFDGMVLEISINGGAFNDIIAAGGSFVTGGYTGTISSSFGSPISGRSAWTGTSGGYITTTVNLPAAANGFNIKLRWRRASDSSVGVVGATIDNIVITGCGVVPPVPCDQNFDGVTAPALPTNWTASTGTACAGSVAWATTNTSFFSAPNSATTNDPTCLSDEYLVSPNILVISASATMSFQRSNNLESTFDGMVLEMKVGAGAFADVTATPGASFAAGGYNGTISSSFSSPIAGRQAWTGNSGGYVVTTVNLPATAINQTVQFRWRRATDVSASAPGVSGAWIDDVTFTGTNCACIITPQADVTVNNDPNQCGAVVTYPAPTTSGSCGTVTSTPASGSFFPVGTTTVTVSSTSGASSTFHIIVRDAQFPTVTCPAPITVSNTPGQCGAIVTFPTPTAADNCPGVTVTTSPVSGSLFPKGTTVVTVTARDAAGNTTTCNTFTVTVNDTQAPTITCPATITVGNDLNLCSAVVTYPLPTYTDNCALPGPTTLSQSSSNTPVAGSVSCNAGGLHTDNSYYRVYDLSTYSLPAPTMTISSVVFGVEQAIPGAGLTTQPVTVKLYTLVGPLTLANLTPIGSQTVNVPNLTLSTFTATLGTPVTVPNTAKVVVELFTPSGQVAGNSFFIGSNASAQTAPCYIAAATCGITQPTDIAAVGFPNMHIILNIAGNSGTLVSPVLLSGIASGGVFPVGTTTNTYRATDVAGNSSTCSFNVVVKDQQAPTFTSCPSNMTLTTPTGSCTAVVNYTITATDNCPGVTVVRTAGPASGTALPLGVTTITHTATDAAGNVSTCTFTVTVLDGQLPIISSQPVNKTGCSGDNVTFSVTSSNAVSYQWQQFNGTTFVNIAGATGPTYTVNSVNTSMNTNSFRVNIVGLCTTVTSSFATLYVNALPTINLVASQAPILVPGQIISITANVNPAGGTIKWFQNGVQVAGANSLVLGGLTVDNIGTYKAVYTDPNGCVSTSSDLVISGQSSSKLWIYPNPTNGQFQVRFYNAVNETVTLNIYDSKGSKVYQRSLTTTIPYTRIDVDLSKASGGAYTVEIRDHNNKQIGGRQVVISHN